MRIENRRLVVDSPLADELERNVDTLTDYVELYEVPGIGDSPNGTFLLAIDNIRKNAVFGLDLTKAKEFVLAIEDKVQRARMYAHLLHAYKNQKYKTGEDYSVHFEDVADRTWTLTEGWPLEKRRDAMAIAYGHDVPEDCCETLNDCIAINGEFIGRGMYALQNEKGENRDQRANEKYYAGIRAHEEYVAAKLGDRDSNISAGLQPGGMASMAGKYIAKESDNFRAKLYVPGQCDAAWEMFDERMMAHRKTYEQILLDGKS